MADIEKMREIFEDVLNQYDSAESDRIGIMAEMEEHKRDIDALRARFNEAAMANQNQTIVINIGGSVTSENDLRELIEKAIRKSQNELRLGSVS